MDPSRTRGEVQEKLLERFRGLSGIFPQFPPESPSRTGCVWLQTKSWSRSENWSETVFKNSHGLGRACNPESCSVNTRIARVAPRMSFVAPIRQVPGGGVPEAVVCLKVMRTLAKFGKPVLPFLMKFTRTSLHTGVTAKVPYIHQSSGEGALSLWVALGMHTIRERFSSGWFPSFSRRVLPQKTRVRGSSIQDPASKVLIECLRRPILVKGI